jgi:hypothetical protein
MNRPGMDVQFSLFFHKLPRCLPVNHMGPTLSILKDINVSRVVSSEWDHVCTPYSLCFICSPKGARKIGTEQTIRSRQRPY